jgi:glycerol-3-phosphate dehydrogenase
LIGGTKGSHILLDHPELVESLNGHMIYFEADDGRICLVYNYLGLAMVGSTDIPATDPESVRCEEPEIDYFLESVRALLPSLRFDRSQVVYTYSGIRPLPASDASSPGLISRDHSAPVMEPTSDRPFAVVSLVGGKWTTFRGFSEEVADLALKRLQRARRQSTQQLAIGGGRDFPSTPSLRQTWVAAISRKTNLDPKRVDDLLSRYGTTASAIVQHAAVSAHSDAERLSGASHYSLLEIDWIARHEFVVHLSDIVLRRTTIAIEAALTITGLREIAAVTAEALGWDQTRTDSEIEDVVNTLSRFHGQTL